MKDHDSSSEDLNSKRRRFLGYLAAAGAGGLAGCGSNTNTDAPSDGTPTPGSGDGDGGDGGGNGGDGGGGGDGSTPTETGTEEPLPDTDKTFVGVMWEDPQKIQWSRNGQGQMGSPWSIDPYLWPKTLPKNTATREWESGIIESFEIEPKKITVKFDENSNWSGGKPVDSKDWGTLLYLWRHSVPVTIPQIKSGEETPSTWVHAVTEFEFNGKELVFHSDRGQFGNFSPAEIKNWGYWQAGAYHWKYMKEYFHEIDAMSDPWTEENQQKIKEMRPDIPPFGWGYTEPDIENAEFSGPFVPVEVQGSKKIVCEINDGHRHADKLNFDGAEFLFQSEPRAIWANLKSGNLSAHVSGDIPPHVVDSFPDKYTRLSSPANSGRSLTLNRHHDMFKPREARAAIMHVLSSDTIAKNINRNTQRAVTKPPAEILPEDFPTEGFQDKLVSYEYDTARATELLNEAGYSKEGGTWMTPDGDEFSFSIMTDSSTPVMETTIADMLSGFGIPTTIETVEQSNFEQRLRNGEYQAIPSGWGGNELAWFASNYLWEVFEGGPNGFFASHGIDVVETIKATEGIEIQRNEFDNVAIERNQVEDGALEPFTIEIPPIGDPDGEREPFPIAEWSNEAVTLTGEKKKEIFSKIYWAYNWDLPELPLTLSSDLVLLDEENWEAPADSSNAWQYNFQTAVLPANMDLGNIQAKPN